MPSVMFNLIVVGIQTSRNSSAPARRRGKGAKLVEAELNQVYQDCPPTKLERKKQSRKPFFCFLGNCRKEGFKMVRRTIVDS